MPRSYPGERLTAEDAVFLYLETNETPLHIGSVSIFDGPIPFEDCVEYISTRLPLIPRYRQRIVTPPFNFGHPTWEDDPEFDIRNHIFHVQLKRGTEAELRTFAGKLFSQIMDRNRPLWDMTVVDGLSGGRSVLISRVHHCLVDGVSGVGLLNLILDPAFQSAPPKRRVRRPPPLPQPVTSLIDAVVTSVFEMVQRVLTAQSEALDVAQALSRSETRRGMDQLARIVPEITAPVDRLPFNQPCAAARNVVWIEIPMPDVKTIRESCGGTLNDVVLTIVTSAVRRYVQLHGAPVKRRMLRLMVPVNLRREGPGNGLGNRVSLLPVSAPLDIPDPVKLLDAIRQRTEALKSARVSDWIHLAATWMGMTPVPVQAAIGPYSGGLPVPPFHMVCTNVPGPQVPLYALGRKMLTYYPYVPIGNHMGLACAVQSYNQTLYFGFTGDAKLVPDVARMKKFLEDAFHELLQAAKKQGKTQQPRPRTTATKSRRPPVTPMTATEANPRPARPKTAKKRVLAPNGHEQTAASAAAAEVTSPQTEIAIAPIEPTNGTKPLPGTMNGVEVQPAPWIAGTGAGNSAPRAAAPAERLRR